MLRSLPEISYEDSDDLEALRFILSIGVCDKAMISAMRCTCSGLAAAIALDFHDELVAAWAASNMVAVRHYERLCGFALSPRKFRGDEPRAKKSRSRLAEDSTATRIVF